MRRRVSVRVRQAAEALRQRGPHARVIIHGQSGAQCLKECRGSGPTSGASPPAGRRLRDGVGGLAANVGEATGQRGQDVRNERGTLESPQRPDGDARRLWIAAANARAKRREVDGRDRPTIFGLQDREPRGVDRLRRGRGRRRQKQNDEPARALHRVSGRLTGEAPVWRRSIRALAA